MEIEMDISTTESGLWDLPDEIQLILMSHLDDAGLLAMTRVCKRFKEIAIEVFNKRYDEHTKEHCFTLDVHNFSIITEQQKYQPYICTFGKSLGGVIVTFNHRNLLVSHNHWLIGLINKHCTSLTHFYIMNGVRVDVTRLVSASKATLTKLWLRHLTLFDHGWTEQKYPNLIAFDVVAVNFDKFKMFEFILNNGQIEDLHLCSDTFELSILYALSGKLNHLKSLRINAYGRDTDLFPYDSNEKLHTIQMARLQSLKIVGTFDGNIMDVIQMFQLCTRMKELVIESATPVDWDSDAEEIINGFAKFKHLRSLKICCTKLTINHFKKMIQRLPTLSSLHLDYAYEHSDVCKNLLKFISIGKEGGLYKLKISVEDGPPELTDVEIVQLSDMTHNNNYKVVIRHDIRDSIVSFGGIVQRNCVVIFPAAGQ